MDAPGPQQDPPAPGDDAPAARSPLDNLHSMLHLRDYQAADALVTADPSIFHLRFGSFPQINFIVDSGYPETLEWLLKWNLDVNERDTFGDTALNSACRRGAIDNFKLLLEYGADISIPGASGDTPIMEAARSQKTDLLELLLDYFFSSWGRRRSSAGGGERKGEEEQEEEEHEEERARRINTVLNVQQNRGQTALAICASSHGDGREAALLLQAGASPFVASNSGFFPLLPAQLARGPILKKLLEEAMWEPERVWRLAQARAVLDARQALQGVLGGGEEEEDRQDGGRGTEQGRKKEECLQLVKS